MSEQTAIFFSLKEGGKAEGREEGREEGRKTTIHTIGLRLRPASYTIDDDKMDSSPVKTSISISVSAAQ